MATHSSTLAWKIPWTEEPDRWRFMGWQTLRHDWATYTSLLHTCIYFKHLYIIWAFLIAQLVKNPPAMQKTPVQFGRSTGKRIGYPLQYSWVSPVAQLLKNSPAMWEAWVRSLGCEDPLRRERLPTAVLWPGEFHGVTNCQTRLSDFHFHWVVWTVCIFWKLIACWSHCLQIVSPSL